VIRVANALLRGSLTQPTFAHMKIPVFFVLSACILFSGYATALELHPLFTDHAVLQQELPVPVWGTAEPEAMVQVTFAGQEHKGKADETGNWMVVLDPLVADAKPRALTVSSGEKLVEVNDVLIGEVWVGSGQSNMAMAVRSSFAAERVADAVEKGVCEGVRLFKVPVAGEDGRESTVNASWALPTNEAIQNFSAAAFYFASKLSHDRSVPVGIIQSANGGTNAYSWINSETRDNDPAADTVRSYWAAMLKYYPGNLKKYEAALGDWYGRTGAAKKAGKPFTERAPQKPMGKDHIKRPGGHYNAMIAPLQPFAIRGVIWYQGEANSRVPFNTGYKDLMLALVEDWRADWATASNGKVERRDFPFYLVQLPNFAGGDPEGWPLIREQMLKFWEEGRNTGMVVAIDKGEADNIHPRDKKPVGERLASFARANTYGENIVFSGPIYDAVQIEEDKAIVTFRYSEAGLASFDKRPLRHFEIAGADAKFHPAKTEIDGDKLIVTSTEVSEPRAVRYAWSSNPVGVNFGNLEGLPASPFRTDSW